MPLFLLLLVTAIYFIRPAEFLPDFLGARLYLWTILPCIAIAIEKWSDALSSRSLAAYPISALVLGLLGITGVIELLAHGSLDSTTGFAKSCVYYFLLVGIVDTDTKRTVFLWGLLFILAALASLMLLSHHGLIAFDGGYSFTEHDLSPEFRQRRDAALGQNFDPNDTALILVPGILIAMHFLVVRQPFLLRALAVGAAMVIMTAVQMTDSRGGFLSLMVGVAVYLVLRWGRKGVMFGVCLLPLLAGLVASERMGGVGSALEGRETGQLRLQFWSEALVLIQQNPLFGLGPGGFGERIGKAAHNMFLQAYVELGFAGGTLFVGVFVCGFVSLFEIIRKRSTQDPERAAADDFFPEEDAYGDAQMTDEQHLELRHHGLPVVCLVAAILAAYAMGGLALNHLYLTNTYVILGLATVTARVQGAQNTIPGSTLLLRLGAASVAFLLFSRILVQLMVRW